jgi:hypothetical protein
MTETFICERRGVKLTVTMQTTSGDAHSILTAVGSPRVRLLFDSKLEAFLARFIADVGTAYEPETNDAPHL